MSKSYKILAGFLFAVVLALAVALRDAGASDTTARVFDRSVAHIESGTTWIDVSAGTYTVLTTLLTIEPAVNTALQDVEVTFDLDFGNGTTGFNGGYTSETIQFAVARKIQGLWRIDANSNSGTLSPTITGTNSDGRSMTLRLGTVSHAEDARVYVILSAEVGDVLLPFVCTYRGPQAATFTTVSN